MQRVKAHRKDYILMAIFTIAYLMPVFCHAQNKPEFGVEAGVTKSTFFGGSPYPLFDGTYGAAFNVQYEKKFNKILAVNISLGYYSSGLYYTTFDIDSVHMARFSEAWKLKEHFIQLSPTLKIALDKHLMVGLGIFGDYGFYTYYQGDYTVYDISDTPETLIGSYHFKDKYPVDVFHHFQAGGTYFIGYQYKNFLIKFQHYRSLTPPLKTNKWNYTTTNKIALVYYFRWRK